MITNTNLTPKEFLLFFTGILPIMLLVPGLPCSVPGYPCLSLAVPALSLAIPALSLSITALSLSVPGIPCGPRVILGCTQVGQEASVAALCSLSLTMSEAGAKLHIPGIKQVLVLINMSAMNLKM